MRFELDAVPLAPEDAAGRGVGLDARLAAATAGDDYELLFSAHPQYRDAIKSLSDQLSLPLSRIGHVETGDGLTICFNGALVDLPSVLGWEHGDTRCLSRRKIRASPPCHKCVACKLYNNLQCSRPNHGRSEERRVGIKGVRTCRSRWWPKN